MNMQILEKCPLFAGIKGEEIAAALKCLQAKQQKYHKDAFIFRTEDPALHVGIVLQGGVKVIQEDFWGNRMILTHIEPGEIFGEAFSCAGVKKLTVSVIAAEATEVLLIDYQKIIYPRNCRFQPLFINNMLQILANKNIMLTRKMGHLSRRTTKEKLLSFLSAQAIQTKNREVVIPYSRQELADFLYVDRSALCRELAKMKKDGLLDYKKNRFSLK